MAVSYEFSIGSVRAKETALFKPADIEQLLVCKDEGELCATLADKGYTDAAGTDEMLEKHTDEMWAYLRGVAPDMSIFDPFILQNDAHNFKVVLKGTMANREYRSLMIEPCVTAHEELIDAVERRQMYRLPEWMQKPCDRAYELLAHTGDARMADAVLDKAVMREMLRLSRGYNSAFLKKYFETLVFYSNIKTALRAARTGTDRDYMHNALCDVEGFRRKEIAAAAVKGFDALLGLLSKCSEYDCKTAVERFKESPSAFERFTDDMLITLARECCKRTSEGAEPLLGYYLGVEAEKKVIHIIAGGIRTNTEPDIIRERLREIYG